MEPSKPIRIKSYLFSLLMLSLTLFVVAISATMIGSINISLSDLYNLFFSDSGDETIKTILFEIRLPRVIFAIIIGGGLSITGAVFQAILMNPLAEPYILGLSSGGTFGTVLALVLGLSFFYLQLFSFVGALSVILIVFILGKRFGELEPNVLLLSGVMIGAFFSAAILLMITTLGDSLRTAVFWMIGSLSFAQNSSLMYVIPIVLIISVFLVINSYKFNLLSLGSENAKHLGVDVKMLKNSTYILSSILVGSVVSVSGIVGFVGLIVPHFCRLIWGVDNRIIIPMSFLVGAIYLTIADTIARTVILPAELPVGAITAIIGAPVFVYLLRKRFKFSF